MRTRSVQTGVTLLEVMIALLVLAVGAAGVASLMLQNVQGTAYANNESQGVALAGKMAEAMRANLAAYEAAIFAVDPGATTADCAADECSATEQAQYDWVQWQARIAAALPAGQSYVCTDSSPDDGQPGALNCDGAGVNVVKVFWVDERHAETRDAGAAFHRLVLPLLP